MGVYDIRPNFSIRKSRQAADEDIRGVLRLN